MQNELAKDFFKNIIQNPDTAPQITKSLMELTKWANTIKEGK